MVAQQEPRIGEPGIEKPGSGGLVRDIAGHEVANSSGGLEGDGIRVLPWPCFPEQLRADEIVE